METVTYKEVKDLPNHPEKLLIDVREHSEIRSTGEIATSINIPIAVLKFELDLNDDEFKDKYSRDKPKSDTEIIFSCKSGGRAQKAAELAVTLGFKNSKVYKGSWTEWAEKEEIQ